MQCKLQWPPHYALVMATLTFATLVIAGAVRASVSVCIKAFENEFGWTRAEISGAVALSILLYGLAGPFAAALMDVWGFRRVVVSACVFAIAGLILAIVSMTHLALLYTYWGVLIGLASGVLAPVLAKVVVNRWFVSHSGSVMGIMAAGAQTGQVAFAPALAALLQAFGWRAAIWLMVAAIGIVAGLDAAFMRERPTSVGIEAYGALPVANADAAAQLQYENDAVGSAAPATPAGPAAPAERGVAALHVNTGTGVIPLDGGAVKATGVGNADDAVADAGTVPDALCALSVLPRDYNRAYAVVATNEPPSTCTDADASPADCDAPLSAASPRTSLPDSGLAMEASSSSTQGRFATNPFLLPLMHLFDVWKTRDFALLAGSFFVCGASTNGLIATHLIPACVDSGMPEVVAAGFLAAIGGFDIVGTILSGMLSDHFDNRVLLAWYYLLRGLALIALPWAFSVQQAGLWPFAVVYGLDWIATVPPTAALCTSCFGKDRSAVVFAWCLASHQLGAAAVAAVAGVVRTLFGTYFPAFWGSGVLCVLTAAAVLAISPAQPLTWRRRRTSTSLRS